MSKILCCVVCGCIEALTTFSGASVLKIVCLWLPPLMISKLHHCYQLQYLWGLTSPIIPDHMKNFRLNAWTPNKFLNCPYFNGYFIIYQTPDCKLLFFFDLGTTFALVASLEVLETLLASLIFNSIYSATVDWLPGFCYFLMSGMTVIPILLLM